mmetsp:Transcript_36119/g.76058  ORF Transcript_36119/g.76058 Transcript_36119/m.76058 type:complete len:105 (-) Transcript_36119:1336-1650(-)
MVGCGECFNVTDNQHLPCKYTVQSTNHQGCTVPRRCPIETSLNYICKPSSVEITNCFSSLYCPSLFSLSLCNPSKYLTNFTLLSNNIFTTSGGLFGFATKILNT